MRSVYPHTPPTTAELTALRIRLYRPDPPEDAVGAYLDALRTTVTAPDGPPMPSPARPRRRAIGVLSAVGAFVTVAVALVGALGSAGHSTAAGFVAPATAAHVALASVPGLRIGTLYGGDGTTGLFDAHGGSVVVSVSCSGEGTVTLRLASEQPVVLTCEAGGPAVAMLSSAGGLDRFTIGVTRSGAVRWSLAVGETGVAGA